jgi:hypothetical protein
MLKLLLNWCIERDRTDIERYIESRNPKTPSDVEHLIQQYYYQRGYYV